MNDQDIITLKPDVTEIIFWVEEDPDGGYVARAIGESIFTQADSIRELREQVKDAVHCHYSDQATHPKLIRLLFQRLGDAHPNPQTGWLTQALLQQIREENG